MIRFVLKTKEQRAAEKALMDKSPLKTLTLEDFLEASRQKLTGSLTPVTPETFAKWKKERLDKKAAEDEARKARDATGRAMFEKGDWQLDEDDTDADDEDGNDNDDDDDLNALRRETEEAGERREMERIRGGRAYGMEETEQQANGVGEDDDDDGDGDDGDGDDGDDGGTAQEVIINGVDHSNTNGLNGTEDTF